MTPSDPGGVRIRNRRYRYWVAIVGLMLVVLFLAVLFLPFALDRRFDRLAKCSLLVVAFAMAVCCLRTWMLVLELTERPLLGRREAARAVWNRVIRRTVPDDPRRVRVTIALTLFGWLAPRRISVASLTLGDTVAFDPRVPVPAEAVVRVRFAPDPAEDYAELECPVYCCTAALELDMGREFRLILDEEDAGLLRV